MNLNDAYKKYQESHGLLKAGYAVIYLHLGGLKEVTDSMPEMHWYVSALTRIYRSHKNYRKILEIYQSSMEAISGIIVKMELTKRFKKDVVSVYTRGLDSIILYIKYYFGVKANTSLSEDNVLDYEINLDEDFVIQGNIKLDDVNMIDNVYGGINTIMLQLMGACGRSCNRDTLNELSIIRSEINKLLDDGKKLELRVKK